MNVIQEISIELDEKKRELQEVLSSPVFVRSVRLEKLLSYLCEKYFAGESDGVKEYNIGVEVLGRRPTFDPSTDAIARVEVHRLRRKLREYYEAEGQDHRIHLTIPTGSYVPAFVRSETTLPGETVQAGQIAEPTVEPEGKQFGKVSVTEASETTALQRLEQPAEVSGGAVAIPRGRISALRAAMLAVALVLAVAAGIVVPGLLKGREGARKTASEPNETGLVNPGASLATASREIRILSGQLRSHLDKAGKLWLPDRFFTGGGEFSRPRQLFARSDDSTLYEHGRSGATFSYDIPLPAGTWELHLYFAETDYGPGAPQGGGETSRLFNVTANGAPLLTGFDIVADAPGSSVADERVFKDISPASDGLLHLVFTGQRDSAMVNGIALIPAPPHRINPVRISTQEISYTDSRGQTWSPDNYWIGGQKPYRAAKVRDTADQDLYAAERFGNFSYSIPVAPGVFDVNVYLAEMYWGPETAPDGVEGRRVFDIFCNGVALGRRIDIGKQVGPNRALVLHYSGLRPNFQGKLWLSFVPDVNYAVVSALEILNTGE